MRTLGFYTQSNSEIGMGHIYRCYRFAKFIQKRTADLQIIFESSRSQIVPETMRADSSITFRQHLDSEIPSHRWDILIVDQLKVPAKTIQSLKQSAKILTSIDDAGEGQLFADFGFNGLYLSEFELLPDASLRRYEGFEYLMLDPIFSQTRPVRKWGAGKRPQVLISQGGSDTYKLVPQILESISELFPIADFHTIVGDGANYGQGYISAIQKFLSKDQIHNNISDMPEFLSNFDLGICGGGMLAFECATLGMPLILMTGEDREITTINSISQHSNTPSCGKANTETPKSLVKITRALIQDESQRHILSDKLSTVVDGRGYERIFKILFEGTP